MSCAASGKLIATRASATGMPEFMQWLTALKDPSRRNTERDRIMDALYDLFDPEPVDAPQ
jgi:hypothetical protein